MKSVEKLILSLLLVFLCLPLADAKVVYVNATAATGGSGTSWATACRFLQDALAQTVAGDEVWVAAGTYFPDDGTLVTAGDRTATFTLKQDVKLYGGFAGGESSITQRNYKANITTFSGEIVADKTYWSWHVVTPTGNNATIDGVVISGSSAEFVGEFWFREISKCVI